MSMSIYSKTYYDYIVIGECVPNAMMAGVIKEEMLTKVSGKGYSVEVTHEIISLFEWNIEIKRIFCVSDKIL